MKFLVIFGTFISVAAAAPNRAEAPLTFYADVLPVLQKNCQGCHRPGEAAPMSFLTYKETRPWAKAIKDAVLTKRMPPWFADPHTGKFANDRSMSESDIRTIVRWADGPAVEGNPKDAPPPSQFIEGWNIGKPEMTVEMPLEFDVPATGTIEYTYFVVPTGFTEDRWIQSAEIRPGNRRVVHHVIAFVREPGSKWLRDAKPGEAFVPNRVNGRSAEPINGGEFLAGFAPGALPEVFQPGQAKLVKAGSDIVLQMHYTANGKPEKDRSKVGFIFASEPPKERVMTIAVGTDKFVIPPGVDNHRVEAELSLAKDVSIMSFLPHMHVRGKSFEYTMVSGGEARKLLSVPRYDFNWQLSYIPEEPIAWKAGDRVETVAYFDNSANNPKNPDPKSEVRFGEQSWEEMMLGFMNIAFDAHLTPRDLFQKPRKPTD